MLCLVPCFTLDLLVAAQFKRSFSVLEVLSEMCGYGTTSQAILESFGLHLFRFQASDFMFFMLRFDFRFSISGFICQVLDFRFLVSGFDSRILCQVLYFMFGIQVLLQIWNSSLHVMCHASGFKFQVLI